MKKSRLIFTISTLLVLGIFLSIPQLSNAQKSQKGSWSKVYDGKVIPVAAANLPDGKILAWSSVSKNNFSGNGQTYTTVFNPKNNSFSDKLVSNTNHDMFCPGISNIGTGEIVVSGGGNSEKTSIYNPANGTWRTGPNLNVTRGYNSQATLTDGTVFNLGGSWSGGRTNKKAEVFSSSGGWRTLDKVDSQQTVRQGSPDPEGIYRDDNHAWLWAAPNNLVFHAGPGTDMHWIETSGQGKITDAGKRSNDEYSMNGISVMYSAGKILTCGGAPSYAKESNASKRAYTIDIRSKNVDVDRVDDMKKNRVYQNSVVLPNGEVVITGGMQKSIIFSDKDAKLTAEIWNPNTKKWTLMASMQEPRTYHSVSILMQDGRVWVAGGGLCGNCDVNHANAEIFTPPYLYGSNNELASRPTINSAPSTAKYDTKITVKTNQSISAFSLVRLSSATHSINNEQRRVALSFSNTGSNNYSVSIPDNDWLPPGYYFLFAMNNNGVPSVAKTIKIGGQANTTSSQQLIANGNYILEGSNGQHLGSPDYDNNNVRMVAADGNKSTNQWTFNHLGNNVYTIKNIGSKRYLETPFGKCDNGSNVATWTKANESWQKWIVSKNGNNYFVQPVHCTSTALDKNSGSSKNVHLWGFSSGNGNQKWQIIKTNNNNGGVETPSSSQLVANGTYVIEGSNGQYLSSPTSNNNVSMKNADSGKKENQWIINHLGNNTYSVKNGDTNRFLEVPYGECGKGSNVATTKFADKNWKKWIISKNGNDFVLKPAHCTSTALDKNNGNSNNVHLWSYSTANGNQKWQITPLNKANPRLAAPVKDLEATPIQNKKTELKWYAFQTEDKKIKQFEVMYVADAYDDFEVIKEVKPTNAIGLEEYTFIHNQPEIGENFYQLKIEFEDGTVDYTMYKLVVFDSAPPEIPIIFNAAKHQLNINLSNYANDAINYFISALNGQVMLHGKISENHSIIEKLDIENLATGNYVIYLRPEHKQEVVQKFVVTGK